MTCIGFMYNYGNLEKMALRLFMSGIQKDLILFHMI